MAKSHKAKSDSVWRQELKHWANNPITVTKPKTSVQSKWAADIVKISRCPQYCYKRLQKDRQLSLTATGMPTVQDWKNKACTCSYHKLTVQPNLRVARPASATSALPSISIPKPREDVKTVTASPGTQSHPPNRAALVSSSPLVPAKAQATSATSTLDPQNLVIPMEPSLDFDSSFELDDIDFDDSTSHVQAIPLKGEAVVPCTNNTAPTPTTPATTPMIPITPTIPTTDVPSTTDVPPTTDVPVLKHHVKPLQLQQSDPAKRCPRPWVMPDHDRRWIGEQLFKDKDGESSVKDNFKKMWIAPSSEVTQRGCKPNLSKIFGTKAFIWMPTKQFGFVFKCPYSYCKKDLAATRVWKSSRRVIGLQYSYYLIGSVLECPVTRMTGKGKTHTFTRSSWDPILLEQLPAYIRDRFDITLTYKYAVDNAVLTVLKARTMGNSPTALTNAIAESHTEDYLHRVQIYLSECERFIKDRPNQEPYFPPTPDFLPPPTAKWLLAAYFRDVMSRLERIRASLTCVYGSILKIDSTKKVCKKLQGHAAGSASWVTNVGNEDGQVLISVVTVSESVAELTKMAQGLTNRYKDAGVEQPQVLYTDRDCCSFGEGCKVNELFSGWPDIPVRLDIWHFMQRLGLGCTSESHPLYAPFMSKLSDCIFDWDSHDFNQLIKAKKSLLQMQGMNDLQLTKEAVKKTLTKEELATHCRRQTRGSFSTKDLLEKLLVEMTDMTDPLGVPLFKTPDMQEIYLYQKRHLPCIQDVPGVQLYKKIRSQRVGRIDLPVYKCARGSNSLENFHLHLNRFIPGTSASPHHFQAYLLEGLSRWNDSRAKEAIDEPLTKMRTFNTELCLSVNEKSQHVFGRTIFPNIQAPEQHTGEEIGMEYLLRQTDSPMLQFDDTTIDSVVDHDEGFDEQTNPLDAADVNILTSVDGSAGAAEPTTDVAPEFMDSVDYNGLPGWSKVNDLAKYLLTLKGHNVTQSQVTVIQDLHAALLDYDKKPMKYRHIPTSATSFGDSTLRDKLSRRGFGGITEMKMVMMRGGKVAMPIDKSRVVEAICLHLFMKCELNLSDTEKARKIHAEYNLLKGRISMNDHLRQIIAIYSINTKLIMTWMKDRSRRDTVTQLLVGTNLPSATATADTAPALDRPTQQTHQHSNPITIANPADTSGLLKTKKRKAPAATATQRSSSTLMPPPPTPPTHPPHPLPVKVREQATFPLPLPKYHSRPVHALESSTGIFTSTQQGFQYVPNYVSDTVTHIELPHQDSISRTTAYRKRKAILETGSYKQPRTYTCRQCDKPMDIHHKTYKRQRWCPHKSTDSFELWKEKKKAAEN